MSLAAVMITMDCAEPQELAQWWATALGGEIAQDHGDFVIVRAQPLASHPGSPAGGRQAAQAPEPGAGR